MMKRILMYLGIAGAALSLTACASTERMTRMSGDVFGSYSSPKAQRIRSEKYAKIKQEMDGRAARQDKDFHLNDNLINIWPFYFRSGDYTSVFWPMIDYDKFGFAFRPFYNHEGDEYSVLFPVSAWNTAEKSGWFAIVFWEKQKFDVFPLVFCKNDDFNGYSIVTPLYMRFWKGNPEKFRSGMKNGTLPPHTMNYRSESGEILLGYYGKQTEKDIAGFSSFIPLKYNPGTRTAMAKQLIGTKYENNVPKDQESYAKVRSDVLENLANRDTVKYGFFPLFHRYFSPSNSRFYLLGPMFTVKKHKSGDEFLDVESLWGLFADYESGKYHMDLESEELDNPSYSKFLSVLLMSYYKRNYRFDFSLPAVKELNSLQNYLNSKASADFTKDVWKEAAARLKKIDPALELPADANSVFKIAKFTENYIRKNEKKLIKKQSSKNIFVPLFIFKDYYHNDGESDSSRIFPVLLTGWNNYGNDSAFFSLPLFSFRKKTERESVFTVGGPLIWYSKTRRLNDSCRKPIYSRDTHWVDNEYAMAEIEDDIAALWLYHHSRNYFRIVKPGYHAEDVEYVRSQLYHIQQDRKGIDRDRKQIRQNEDFWAKRKVVTEAEVNERDYAVNELKKQRMKLEQREQEHQQNIIKYKEAAQKIGFPGINPEKDDIDDISKMVVEKCSELRGCDDYGSYFLRREVHSNGDGNWRLLFGLLAGGEKINDTEKTHVLYYLYRYTRKGDKSEKLIFPFITVQKDGGSVRRSFMWRVWSLEKKNGKIGGYFLFVPFGHHE